MHLWWSWDVCVHPDPGRAAEALWTPQVFWELQTGHHLELLPGRNQIRKELFDLK